MPGLYADGDFDMAGFVVGAVERDTILDGSDIRPGDAIIGIPSNGLHTNGYSLVRHALGLDDDPAPLNEVVPELGESVTLGDALLMPHPSYVEAVRPVLHDAQGDGAYHGRRHRSRMYRASCRRAHPRASTRPSWRVPPIFTLLQERAAISRDEMYRVFNMGIGMALVCDASQTDAILASVPDAELVGEVIDDINGERVSIV